MCVRSFRRFRRARWTWGWRPTAPTILTTRLKTDTATSWPVSRLHREFNIITLELRAESHRQEVTVLIDGVTLCWFWSFHGIVWQCEKYKITPDLYLNWKEHKAFSILLWSCIVLFFLSLTLRWPQPSATLAAGRQRREGEGLHQRKLRGCKSLSVSLWAPYKLRPSSSPPSLVSAFWICQNVLVYLYSQNHSTFPSVFLSLLNSKPIHDTCCC